MAADLAWITLKIVGIATAVALVAILAIKILVLAWKYPAASYGLALGQLLSRLWTSHLWSNFVKTVCCLWQVRYRAYQGCIGVLAFSLFVFDTIFWEWPQASLKAIYACLIECPLFASRYLAQLVRDRADALQGNEEVPYQR